MPQAYAAGGATSGISGLASSDAVGARGRSARMANVRPADRLRKQPHVGQHGEAAIVDFGWTEGRNIRFDYRFTGESTERMRIAATEVVAMAPDVIFVTTNPVVSALMQVTRTIPIVFTWVSDSVGSGYVANFAHPGGNITGFHNCEPALGAKWKR